MLLTDAQIQCDLTTHGQQCDTCDGNIHRGVGQGHVSKLKSPSLSRLLSRNTSPSRRRLS